jgi:hypothetical protein
MDKNVFRLFTMAGLLVTLLTVSAQAQTAHLLTADIPFDFVISNKVLPAGNYNLEPIGGLGTLKIHSAKGNIALIVMTQLISLRARQDELKLVFNRFGDQYFISQVVELREGMFHQLSKSRMEVLLAKNPDTLKRISISSKVH